MGCCMGAPEAHSNQRAAGQGAAPERPITENANQREQQRAESQSRRSQDSRAAPQQRNSRGARASQGNPGLRITYLQNPGVEIIKADKIKGEGVLKTLAYDTPLDRPGLEKWRNEFWETRVNGSKHVWLLLRNACDADHETAAALVEAAQLQLPQDSLTTAIDQGGVYYRVPICCIADPDNYSIDNVMDALKAKKAPAEKSQTVQVRNVQMGSHSLTVSNQLTVEGLKKAYLEAIGPEKVTEHGLSEDKVRLFSMGQELKNDLFIYSYNIKDNMVIQAMFRK